MADAEAGAAGEPLSKNEQKRQQKVCKLLGNDFHLNHYYTSLRKKPPRRLKRRKPKLKLKRPTLT